MFGFNYSCPLLNVSLHFFINLCLTNLRDIFWKSCNNEKWLWSSEMWKNVWNKSDSLDMLTHRARLGLRFDEERKTFVEPLTIVSIVNWSYFDRRLIRHEAGFLTDKSVFLFLQNAANITTLNSFRLSNMNKFTIRGFVVEYLCGFNPWIHETVLG